MKVNRAIPPEGKIVYYRSDGSGRDTYIRESNGGLLSKDRIYLLKTFKPPKQRNFIHGKAQYNRHPSNFKSSKSNNFTHYISDGSGRDFYVTSNEGGNSNVFRWRDRTDYKFKSSLRHHDPLASINPEKEDQFAKSQMKCTLREETLRRTLGPIQRQLDVRLSEPKRSSFPPPVYTYFDRSFNTLHSLKMSQATNRLKQCSSFSHQCTHKRD